mmetsp:Transcript_89277/g.237301  ORF Transcript_89277/g.237301 Transcript_89277/m.237301 type:complete len:204 (-) Transcript_89277:458-1069(-)
MLRRPMRENSCAHTGHPQRPHSRRCCGRPRQRPSNELSKARLTSLPATGACKSELLLACELKAPELDRLDHEVRLRGEDRRGKRLARHRGAAQEVACDADRTPLTLAHGQGRSIRIHKEALPSRPTIHTQVEVALGIELPASSPSGEDKALAAAVVAPGVAPRLGRKATEDAAAGVADQEYRWARAAFEAPVEGLKAHAVQAR